MNELIPQVLLRDGSISAGTRSEMTLRRRHVKVALSLALEGKVVIDIGCDVGLYSMYLARSAAKVFGIDRNQKAIEIGSRTAAALNIQNVTFLSGDYEDYVGDLPKADLIIMWGFLHRVPDVFGLIATFCSMPALSFEWQTPIFPGMEEFAMALYPTTRQGQTPNLFGMKSQKLGANCDGSNPQLLNDHYLEYTPRAISEIAADFGYGHSKTLGFSDELLDQAAILRRYFTEDSQLRQVNAPERLRPKNIGVERVHMVVEKESGYIKSKPLHDFSVDSLPSWDVGMQKVFGAR